MAGTINLALTQQFDINGNPLTGGLLYFYAASTTTPQNAFQDIALTIPWPNPLVLDSSGRVPMFYLADGNIKIRLTDKGGVVQLAADNLLVIGPSAGGGGGGGGVDPTTILATGDIKTRFGTGPLTGFVRCNSLTIGNAVSGATERANADCQALFQYLWSTNVLGVFSGVTPSRGASALADWNANKNIALPDLRGRTIAGMDDMGATVAGRLTATGFGSSGIVLGNAGGVEARGIAQVNLPSIAFPVTGSFSGSGTGSGTGSGSGSGSGSTDARLTGVSIQGAFTGISASTNANVFSGGGIVAATGGIGYGTAIVNISDPSHAHGVSDPSHAHAVSTSVSVSVSTSVSVSVGGSISGSASSGGSNQVFITVTPSMIMTVYIKL
jgi:hypothetical protein